MKVMVAAPDSKKSHRSLVKRLMPLPSAPNTIAISSLPFLNEDILFVEFHQVLQR